MILKISKYIFFVLLLFNGFLEAFGNTHPKIVTLDSIRNKQALIEAGHKAGIHGKTIIISECVLWRDFMPISPKNGYPLSAVIRFGTEDSSKFPGGIIFEKLYIINKQKVWITSLTDETRPNQPDSQIVKIAINGPKWGPHIYVDVVIKMLNRAGVPFYIRLKKQLILKTS